MNKKQKKKDAFVMMPPTMGSAFDPLGSWTGSYMLGDLGALELPDQDVDDL